MAISTDSYTALAADMLKLYEESERRLIETVKARLLKGIDTPGWAEKKLAEVQKTRAELQEIVEQLEKDRMQMVGEMINTAYEGSVDGFILEARQAGTVKDLDLSGNATKAAQIIADVNNRMDAADRTILRRCNDAYADIVAHSTALVANGTITLREAVNQELQAFAAKGISSFTDAAGRTWDMATYAEMATLTGIERATREGYLNTMQEYGYDLAIISAHAGACPLCEAWQDVIISVSGTNRDYPSLADAENGGCFHPRCLHHISTYYEGITTGGKTQPRMVLPPSEEYSKRQEKRALERSVRLWKRRMSAAADPATERKAYGYVRAYQGKIRALIDDYNRRIPESHDMLMRAWSHEGARAVLSPDAAKLRPVTPTF